ncbi:MAG: hypothetical protein GY730_01200 [bacterium]|nr:hypothetical protein [bacterium]
MQNFNTGKLDSIDTPVPSVFPNSVLIRTAKSLISLGTEKMLVDFGKFSLLNKAIKKPEKVKPFLQKIKTNSLIKTVEAVKNKLSDPITPGYSNVEVVVVATGSQISDLKTGDRVVSNGSHAEFVNVSRNLLAKVPDNVDDTAASFTVVINKYG